MFLARRPVPPLASSSSGLDARAKQRTVLRARPSSAASCQMLRPAASRRCTSAWRLRVRSAIRPVRTSAGSGVGAGSGSCGGCGPAAGCGACAGTAAVRCSRCRVTARSTALSRLCLKCQRSVIWTAPGAPRAPPSEQTPDRSLQISSVPGRAASHAANEPADRLGRPAALDVDEQRSVPVALAQRELVPRPVPAAAP